MKFEEQPWRVVNNDDVPATVTKDKSGGIHFQRSRALGNGGTVYLFQTLNLTVSAKTFLEVYDVLLLGQDVRGGDGDKHG